MRWNVNIKATRPRPHTAMRDEQYQFVVVSGDSKTSCALADKEIRLQDAGGCPLLWGAPSTAMKGQRLVTARFAADVIYHGPPHELESRRFGEPTTPHRRPPASSWGQS